jgi:hypothetical protein
MLMLNARVTNIGLAPKRRRLCINIPQGVLLRLLIHLEGRQGKSDVGDPERTTIHYSLEVSTFCLRPSTKYSAEGLETTCCPSHPIAFIEIGY